MCEILISINPEYVEKILSGEKKYEFRKINPKRKVDKLIIYETYPLMKVVAEAEVKKTLYDSLESIWNMTKEFSGITKEFFDDYYINKEKALAFELVKVKKFQIPKDLSDYNIKVAPQSFIYLD